MGRIYQFLFIVGICTGTGVSKATNCTSRGRFPNHLAEDCRGFTMCIFEGNLKFKSWNLTCPEGSVYSHTEMHCTTVPGYQCAPSFNCTETGNFKSPFNENCTSFIACVQGLSGIVTARQIYCPQDHVFNNVEGVCVKSTEFICKTGIVSTGFFTSGSASTHMCYATVLTLILFISLK